MSWLFKIEGKKVTPNPETLLISPFKEIWERDNSEHKTMAMKEFAYAEFMTSMMRSNPYSGYNEKMKEGAIMKDIFGGEKWHPDDLVYAAMNKIDEFQNDASPSMTLYKAALHAKENLEEHLRTFDILGAENRTQNGSMIIKPADVTRALKDMIDVSASLENMRTKVQEEMFESRKVRGDKEISPFAKKGI